MTGLSLAALIQLRAKATHRSERNAALSKPIATYERWFCLAISNNDVDMLEVASRFSLIIMVFQIEEGRWNSAWAPPHP